jgi:hypothetical protein
MIKFRSRLNNIRTLSKLLFKLTQDLAGLNNTAVVERVLDEALDKRKANFQRPVCLVIDGMYSEAA